MSFAHFASFVVNFLCGGRGLFQLFVIDKFPVRHELGVKDFDQVGEHVVGVCDATLPNGIAAAGRALL